MRTPRPAGATLLTSVNLILLGGAAVLTALEYPRIALTIHRLLSHEGGDGSGLGFVRDRYLLPGIIAFLVLLVLTTLFAARRRQHMRLVISAGWLVLLTGVVSLTQWYFHTPRATSDSNVTARGLPGASVVSPFADQMTRLGIREALVLGSQSVDELPVWSPDGRYLAAKVDGDWLGVEPDSLKLKLGEWHDRQPIGIVDSTGITVPLSDDTVHEWKKSARSDPRRVTTRDGTRFELRQVELGTRFVVKTSGAAETIRWTTSLENCHGLALSPDDRRVAFLCETNGVIVATP